MDENKKPVFSQKNKIFLFFTYFSAFGTVLGGIGAYIYYLKAGCASGTCAITSNPWLSTLWGAVMGFLIGDILSPRKMKDDNGDGSPQ
jgi:hypothetical protein